MTWKTLETEEDRPPLRIFSRQELDYMLEQEKASNRSKAQQRPPASPSQVNRVKRELKKGTPVAHVAIRCGLGRDTVYRIKQEAGL